MSGHDAPLLPCDRPHHGLEQWARRHRARPRFPETPYVYPFATRWCGAAHHQILRVTADVRFARTCASSTLSPASPLASTQRRAPPYRPRWHALRHDRVTRATRRPPKTRVDAGQDPQAESGRGGRAGEPVRIARLGLRYPQLVRSGVRSGHRQPLGDRERPGVQRRAESDRARGELRLGTSGGLRVRHATFGHEPRWAEPDPSSALVHPDDRADRVGVLRRLRARSPLGGHALLRHVQHRGSLACGAVEGPEARSTQRGGGVTE